MRTKAPFQPSDLEDLDRLLSKAIQVCAMREIVDGVWDPRIIGLRHDVDNVIEPAVEFAMWEADRGYRSTYYILHTAPYWQDKRLLEESVGTIAAYGHEIGIHNNALAEAVRTGDDPLLILSDAIDELEELTPHPIRGTVAHGDPDCYRNGKVVFVNDQIFAECLRPEYLPPEASVPLDAFGLDYDANWIKRAAYLSDSGGTWSQSFDLVRDVFPFPNGQLHMLVHPDWWVEAFTKLEVPA